MDRAALEALINACRELERQGLVTVGKGPTAQGIAYAEFRAAIRAGEEVMAGTRSWRTEALKPA